MAYYLQMNGTTDVVQVPSFAWDQIELDCMVNPLTNFSKIIGLAGGGYVQYNSGLNFSWDGNFGSALVNGTPVTSGTAFMTANVRAVLTANRSSSTAILSYLFRTFSTSGYMRGNLYSAKFYLSGVLQCHYNFTLGNATDQTGNGRNGTVTGTFINDGPSSTPVSYLYDTLQQIVVNRSTQFDTSQQIVKNVSVSIDTQQHITVNRSYLFDTRQEIGTETVKVSYLYDTKQTIVKNISLLFPTQIIIYKLIPDTIRDYTVRKNTADSRKMDWKNRDR